MRVGRESGRERAWGKTGVASMDQEWAATCFNSFMPRTSTSNVSHFKPILASFSVGLEGPRTQRLCSQ